MNVRSVFNAGGGEGSCGGEKFSSEYYTETMLIAVKMGACCEDCGMEVRGCRG